MVFSRMSLAVAAETTLGSTSALTVTTRWPSWRRMAGGEVPELSAATRPTGTSAPAGVRSR